MKQIRNVLVVGVGGAGILAALQFPDSNDFQLNRLIIDYPEALFKLTAKEDVTFIPLGSLRNGRKPRTPKSRERAERDFNAIRTGLMDELGAADAIVMFTGLGGVVGSICALGVAQMAHSLQRSVVANVFMPFASESSVNHAAAAETIKELAPLCVFTCTISHAALNVVLDGNTEVARMLNAVQALHVWHSRDVLRMINWL